MAKINELRNKLILRMVIYVLIIGGIFAVYSFAASTSDEALQKYKWLKNDIDSLQSKIRNLDTQKVEFANAVKIWENLSDYQKAMKGVQITRAESVLTALYEKYHLNNVSTTFSAPALLDIPEMKKELVLVEVSDTNSMSFGVYNDQQVYGFIEELRKTFPGYIKITNLSLTRVENISQTSLRRISEGETPPLVNVKIDFVWYALKEPVKDSNVEAQ